jgi:hypothetical protein
MVEQENNNFLPTIWFKFDTNRTNNVGDKMFLIAETEHENNNDALSSSDSLSVAEAFQMMEDGDVLLSGNYYFMFNKKSGTLDKISESVISTMLKI